jgi:hypothetical protein
MHDTLPCNGKPPCMHSNYIYAYLRLLSCFCRATANTERTSLYHLRIVCVRTVCMSVLYATKRYATAASIVASMLVLTVIQTTACACTCTLSTGCSTTHRGPLFEPTHIGKQPDQRQAMSCARADTKCCSSWATSTRQCVAAKPHCAAWGFLLNIY